MRFLCDGIGRSANGRALARMARLYILWWNPRWPQCSTFVLVPLL